jgi:hypothetical protein
MKKKSIVEETAPTTAPATEKQPKAEQKANRAPRGAHVAPAKGKAGKKATRPRKSLRARRKPPRSQGKDDQERSQVREDPGTAAPAGRRDGLRLAKGRWLAGSFRTRVPFRDGA